MPLCPQITNTPITVVLNSDFTVTSVVPVLPADTVQVAAAQQSATDAYNAAVAAGTAASAAQTTANGKNKVTYSTSTPGSTANTSGDIWYQYGTAAPNVGRIIAQYSGAGGTSWTQTTISGLVVANIDAGSITTGTISVGLGITTGSGTFTVNAATGALFANSATITGAITATSGTFTGTINSTAGNIAGFTLSSDVISAPSSSLNIYSNGTIQGGNSQTIFYGYANIGGGTAGSERLIVTGNSNFNGTIISSSSITAQGELYAVFGGSNTVTNTANTWISSGGQIRRTTASSLRYKENVTDLVNVDELNPKRLLDLPVRAFTYKQEYLAATDDRYQQIFPGFISEEVDAIYPMAADYENGQVESWNDRLLLPGMLALIQDLYKEIATLKGE
jgi:hypothetical protein